MEQEYTEYLNGKLKEFKYLYIEDVSEELVARNIQDTLRGLSLDDIKELLRNGFGGFCGEAEEAVYKTRFKIELCQLHYLSTLNDQHRKRLIQEHFKWEVR